MLQLGSGVVKWDFPRIDGYVVSLRLPPEDWLKSEPFLEAGGGDLTILPVFQGQVILSNSIFPSILLQYIS